MSTGPPLAERTDDECMQLARLGQREAFGVVIERHLERVTRYCTKYVGDAQQGEDLAQEVFLELWRRRAEYVAEGKLRLLLLTIARNRCCNVTRMRRRWAMDSLDEGESAAEHLALTGTDSAQLERVLELESHRRVHEAIAKLPTKLREAVLLRFDQSLDYPEIARIVGKGESTVRSRVFHGLRKLRELLAGEPS